MKEVNLARSETKQNFLIHSPRWSYDVSPPASAMPTEQEHYYSRPSDTG